VAPVLKEVAEYGAGFAVSKASRTHSESHDEVRLASCPAVGIAGSDVAV
jgi:hypothetical protein